MVDKPYNYVRFFFFMKLISKKEIYKKTSYSGETLFCNNYSCKPVPFNPKWDYGDTYYCPNCKTTYIIAKPEPIKVYSNHSVKCEECLNNPCTCGCTIVVPLLPHLNDGYYIGNFTSVSSLIEICIDSTGKTKTNSSSAWDMFVNKKKDEKVKKHNLSTSPAVIYVYSPINEIYEKVKLILLKIFRALASDHAPPYK